MKLVKSLRFLVLALLLHVPSAQSGEEEEQAFLRKRITVESNFNRFGLRLTKLYYQNSGHEHFYFPELNESNSIPLLENFAGFTSVATGKKFLFSYGVADCLVFAAYEPILQIGFMAHINYKIYEDENKLRELLSYFRNGLFSGHHPGGIFGKSSRIYLAGGRTTEKISNVKTYIDLVNEVFAGTQFSSVLGNVKVSTEFLGLTQEKELLGSVILDIQKGIFSIGIHKEDHVRELLLLPQVQAQMNATDLALLRQDHTVIPRDHWNIGKIESELISPYKTRDDNFIEYSHCAQCAKVESVKRCCENIFYCDVKCQKKHRVTHRAFCKKLVK